MTKETTRVILVAFGLLDLLSFYRSYNSIPGTLDSLTFLDALSLVFILQSLFLILILSLPLSGLLTIFTKKSGLQIYYFQFPIKLTFLTLTFGFVLRLFNLQIGSILYNTTMGIAIGLEVLRLGLTIYIHRKNYKETSEVASPQQSV